MFQVFPIQLNRDYNLCSQEQSLTAQIEESHSCKSLAKPCQPCWKTTTSLPPKPRKPMTGRFPRKKGVTCEKTSRSLRAIFAHLGTWGYRTVLRMQRNATMMIQQRAAKVEEKRLDEEVLPPHTIHKNDMFTYIYHKNLPNVGKYTCILWVCDFRCLLGRSMLRSWGSLIHYMRPLMLASTFPDQWILIRSRKVNDNDIRQQGLKRIVCNFSY